MIIDCGNGYEIYTEKLLDSQIHQEDGYEYEGFIYKNDMLLEDFEGSGHFSTEEDAVEYLKKYLEKVKG